MLLCYLEVARDHLNRLGYTICGGLISPTHDLYNKKDLVPSSHRCAMIKQALVALPWVKMSDWEVKQNGWSRTRQVLQYHQVNIYLYNCIRSTNFYWFRMLIFQNHLNIIISSRLNGTDKVDSSLLPVQFVENIDITDLSQNRAINIRLLCGADLLESFAVPGLWNEEDVIPF